MAKVSFKSRLDGPLIISFVVTVVLFCLLCEQGPPKWTNTSKSDFISGNFGFVSAQSPMSTSNDTNWAGYIVTSDLQNPQATVTGVSASWTVPTVKISNQDTFSAVWIGIGGFFDSTLIQTGTEQDSIQGQSEYSAWIEFLPQTSITLDSITVLPGDQITASIQQVDPGADEWTISLKNLNTNQSFSNNFFYASSQLSAEWIVERPEISTRRSRGTLTTLADVGTAKFTNCQAMIGGTNGTISSFPVVQSVMYQSVQAESNLGQAQIAAVSSLSSNGSSFMVETSLASIPELTVLTLLPIAIGVSLFKILKRKHRFFFLR